MKSLYFIHLGVFSRTQRGPKDQITMKAIIFVNFPKTIFIFHFIKSGTHPPGGGLVITLLPMSQGQEISWQLSWKRQIARLIPPLVRKSQRDWLITTDCISERIRLLKWRQIEEKHWNSFLTCFLACDVNFFLYLFDFWDHPIWDLFKLCSFD